MSSIGILEAVTGALGEADNEIGGLRQTRLRSAVQPVTSLVAVLNWVGTTTIATADTSEVEIGDWVGLDVDGQLYQVVGLTPNTSLEIDNPAGYTIPTGSTSSSKATRTLPVESVVDWPSEGKVGIDGVAYYYGARSNQELREVTHLFGGVVTAGVKRIHASSATVVDLSRTYSAIDQVRRAMLVEYAEGDDLNALGRNLGVNRLPFVGSDDVFRAIVKALAYNPKGTVFGIELALEALVGAGNFEIIEKLRTDPCTVFIRLVGAAVLNEIYAGKAFISGAELQPLNPSASLTTFQISGEVVDRGSVASVRWKDEEIDTPCESAYPSAQTVEEYPGDTPHAVWTLFGTGVFEGTHIRLLSGGTQWFLVPPSNYCGYQRKLRIVPESNASLSFQVLVPGTAAVEPSIIAGLRLSDGTRKGWLGIKADTVSTFQVGIVSAGAFVGTPVSLPRDSWADCELRKIGTSWWELYVNGNLRARVPYLTSYTDTLHGAQVGQYSPGPISNKMTVRQLNAWVGTATDYWSARGDLGQTYSVGQTTFNTGASVLDPGDIGKVIAISGSTAVNPQGGNNNGRFLLTTYYSAISGLLGGIENPGAAVTTANPDRVIVPITGQQFQYPDDLGKQLVISGSSLGNDGVYTIIRLLQAGSLVDLASGAMPVRETTNVCEVSGSAFVTEASLTWKLDPLFVSESNLHWELSSAGSVTGTTVALRQNLPLTSSDAYRVLEVTFSQVLSAQVLLDALVQNLLLETDPNVLFSRYPFYLSDPLGFVRTYVDDITAAGMIPDFIVE